MDPLTIATAAGSAIKALYKVSEKTYTFAKDAKIVDQVLSRIRSDLSSLLVVLETVKSTLRKPQQLIIAHVDNNSAFLSIVHAAIQECHDTAETIEQILDAIVDGNVSTSLVARSIRQVKFMNRKDDLRKVQAHLKAQKSNLQLLLQMLNVSIAHYPASMLRDTISPQMNVLESMLRKALIASTSEPKNKAIMPQPQDSEVFTTESKDTKPGLEHISGVPVENVNGSGEVPAFAPFASDDAYSEDMAYESTLNAEGEVDDDSDNELEAKHTMRAFTSGKTALEEKSFDVAAKLLRSALKTAAAIRDRRVDQAVIKEIQLHLALACLYSEDWDDALEILHHLAFEDTVSKDKDLLRPTSLLALAKVCLAKQEFDSAIAACREARAGFKKNRGKSYNDYAKASELLVLIYILNGDHTADDFYGNDSLFEKELSLGSMRTGLELLQSNTYRPTNYGLTGAAWNKFTWLEKRGSTLLLAAPAGHEEVVRILLLMGVNVDFSNQTTQETALMKAAENGHTKIVHILMREGAHVHAKDKYGKTALQKATEAGRRGCENSLLGMVVGSSTRIEPSDVSEHSPGDELYQAALAGRDHVIQRLVAEGMSPDTRSTTLDRTALSAAVEKGHQSTVALLLKLGADPNLTMMGEDTDWTALMYAARSGKTNIAAYLIKYGAHLDARDGAGYAALDIAQASQHKNIGPFREKKKLRR